MLAQGNERPQPAQSFVGKAFAKQFIIYQEEMIKNDRLRPWITSGRGGRALKKELYKKINWPLNIPEDVYLHLFCKKRDFKTEFSSEALCLYKSPDAYKEIKQEIKKVKSGANAIEVYFSQLLLKRMYHRPLSFRILCAYIFFKKNFIYFFTYFFLSFYLSGDGVIFSDMLPSTQTTKQVYGNIQ
jgi:hypothetical protein